MKQIYSIYHRNMPVQDSGRAARGTRLCISPLAGLWPGNGPADVPPSSITRRHGHPGATAQGHILRAAISGGARLVLHQLLWDGDAFEAPKTQQQEGSIAGGRHFPGVGGGNATSGN